MSICKFKKLFMAMLVLMLSTSLLCTFFACNPSQPDPEDDEPSLIRLVVPKDWELEVGDSRTVDVHVKRIREKLEDVSDKWELRTVWSVGYKFETKD